MRLTLGILAVLGVLVIGFAVAIAAGWLRVAHVDPFAKIQVNPATQPKAGQTDTAAAVTEPEEEIPEPPPVVDRTVMLRPEDARLLGRTRLSEYTQSIYSRTERKQITKQMIGGFSSPEDGAEWTLKVAKPGKYTVTFDYAAAAGYGKRSSGEPLGSVEFKAGQSVFTAEIKATRSGRSFEMVDMGTIDLPEGETKITLRPTGKTTLSLMVIRSVRLFPMN